MSVASYFEEEDNGLIYKRFNHMAGGSWISYERRVVPGTMRVINGVISRAFHIKKRWFFRKSEILWVSVNPEALKKISVADRPSC